MHLSKNTRCNVKIHIDVTTYLKKNNNNKLKKKLKHAKLNFDLYCINDFHKENSIYITPWALNQEHSDNKKLALNEMLS